MPIFNKSWLKLLILGFLLRLLFIDKHALWYDEIASLAVINSTDFNTLLFSLAVDTHPPLYFLLLKIWSLISANYLFLRFFSVVWGSLSIYLAYLIFIKLTDSRKLLLPTLLITLSPFLIYYSTEIRMYSLFVFEILLLINVFLEYLHKQNIKYLFLFMLVSVIALYTHYYAALVLITLNFIFMTKYYLNKGLLFKWALNQLVILALFVPWLIFALPLNKFSCWCFNPIVGITSTFAAFVINGMGIITLKDLLFYAPKTIAYLYAGFVFYFNLLFIIGGIKIVKMKQLWILSFIFIPLAVLFSIGWFFPIFSPRALIFITPIYYLIIYYGTTSFKNNLLRLWVKLSIISIFLFILTVEYFHPFFHQPISFKSDYIFNQIEFHDIK